MTQFNYICYKVKAHTQSQLLPLNWHTVSYETMVTGDRVKSVVRFIEVAHALLKCHVKCQYDRKSTNKYLLIQKRHLSTVRRTTAVISWALLWLCLYTGSVPKPSLHPKRLYLTQKDLVSHQNSFAWPLYISRWRYGLQTSADASQ